MSHTKNISLITELKYFKYFFFFILGSVLHLLAYASINPILIAGFFFLITLFSLKICLIKLDYFLISSFLQLFTICWITAGVAALYFQFFGDESQLYGDAGVFFEIVTDNTNDFSLLEMRLLHEGSLAIVVWRKIYAFLFFIGFPKERYVGITINIINVVLSGIVILKSVKYLFNDNRDKLERCLNYLSLCGLFWLFASIHLRDSFVLLVLTVVYHSWVRFLCDSSKSYFFFHALFVSTLATILIYFLRGSIVFIPPLIAILALLVKMLKRERLDLLFFLKLTIFISSLIFLFAYTNSLSSFINAIQVLNEGYGDLSKEQHSSSSLGVSLIISQPIFVRIPLSLIYAYIFPIPIWSGVTSGVYWLFISCNTILFYFLIPNIFYSIIECFSNFSKITSGVLFMVLCFIFLSIGVAFTSLEVRHIATVFPAIFALSVFPEYREKNIRYIIKMIRFYYIAIIIVIHIIWATIKFL